MQPQLTSLIKQQGIREQDKKRFLKNKATTETGRKDGIKT